MPHTRPSLLSRLSRSADSTAWTEFVELYRPFLLRATRHAGVPVEEAADVVQDIFVSLIRWLPRFGYEPSRGTFRAWLSRLARNAAIDWHRRRETQHRTRSSARKLAQQAERHPPVLRESSATARIERFQRALAVLQQSSHPQSWHCFEQHLLAGRPARDVACELNLTQNCVYVNASRLLARVRRMCNRPLP